MKVGRSKLESAGAEFDRVLDRKEEMGEASGSTCHWEVEILLELKHLVFRSGS